MVDMPLNSTKPNHIYLIFMYKAGFALSNLQWLICHKTNQSKSFIFNIYIYIYIYKEDVAYESTVVDMP